ncbi:MAG: Ig-like domain-containing protein [Euryarchaeota archaeon]|nr:Ig-like domain-containing protein [Euryarchaeota archaeon]
MKGKILATIMALGMIITAFSVLGIAQNDQPIVTGAAHTISNQIIDATNGSAMYCLVGPDALPNTADDVANGITYSWDISQGAFAGFGNATETVCFMGWASIPGFPNNDNFPQTWRNRSDVVPTPPYRSRVSADIGSRWTLWSPGDYAVQCTEVFYTNTSDGYNYSAMFEQPMSNLAADNMGTNVTLERIGGNTGTPYKWSDGGLIGADNVSAPYQGVEHAWMDYGYGVWTSMAAINPGNPGVYQADMAKNPNGTWQWQDPAFANGRYYALRQKWCWNGSALPAQTFYTYGYSKCIQINVVADTATATGPVGRSNDNTPDVTYTTTGAPATVDVYYSSDAGTSWTNGGTDNPATSPYTLGVLADGTYFWSVKSPSEAVPSGAGSIEAGAYIIDTVLPTPTPIPANGTTGVLTTTNFDLTWNEWMDTGFGTTTIQSSPASAPGGAWAWFDNQTYRYSGMTWAGNTWYWINITTGTFRDISGNIVTQAYSFNFKTADPTPPDTTINVVTPNPYIGALPDDVTLIAMGTDNATGGSAITGIDYRIDRNDDGDFLDAGEAWTAMTTLLGSTASWAQYSTVIDLHNASIATPNIEARATDGLQDPTQAVLTYTVSDTTAPAVTYIAPTPANTTTIPAGPKTVTLTAADFRDVQTLGTARITAYYRSNHTLFFPENTTMTFGGWALGSNIDTFTYTWAVPGGADVAFWTYIDDGAQVAQSPAYREFNTGAGSEPTNPLDVAGRIFLYNGSVAGGYNPGNVSGAAVSIQTVNSTNVLITKLATSDMAGNYIVTFNNTEYVDGGLIYVNTTTPAAVTSVYVAGQNFTFAAPDWRNWTTSTAVDGAGLVWINATLGIPYNLTVSWVPDWLLGSNAFNTFPAGTVFNVLSVIYDNRSRVCPGYYGTLLIRSNESNAVSAAWTFVPASVGGTVTLDGLGGAVSPILPGANVTAPFAAVGDGVYGNTASLWNVGVWALWVNDTFAPVGSLAPGVPGYSAFFETDNTHVQIVGGGFYWKPLAGWNLISVPMNTTTLYGPAFTASDVDSAVTAAALLYGVALTSAFVSNRLAGSPATYETYDIVLNAGIDFTLNIDNAYWLYVNAAITAVYVQAEELIAGDVGFGQISAAGINDVTLVAGWNMVNSGLNATSREFGLGANAPNFVDAAGHAGNWSNNNTILYTGGGQTLNTFYGWYDQPIGASHRVDRQDTDPGNYLTASPDLRVANTWDPATQSYVTGCSYADWFGLWRQADGYNNYGRPVYYASGFWVYAEAGGVAQYDING